MCGRFTIISDPINYQLEFDFDLGEDIKNNWKSRYNVSPTQFIPVVGDAINRKVTLMQWGLVPAWAKGKKAKLNLINVRSETIIEKPFFRKLIEKGQLCFILADGFYEWKKHSQKGQPKTPYYFHLKTKKPLALAGIWDVWKTSDDQMFRSCAIITCAPNLLIGAVHNRMPVILNSNSAWEWISQKSPAQLLSLLKPYPEEELISFPVSRLVNNPAVNSPECILPVNG